MKKIIILLMFMSIFGTAYSTNDPTAIKNKETNTEMVFTLEDERYINDIPFDTKRIAVNYYLEKVLHILFPNEKDKWTNIIKYQKLVE